MVNLKSLFAICALGALVAAAACLAPIGFDFWQYRHAAGAGAPNLTRSGVDYDCVIMVVISLVMFVFFVLLYLSQKH